MLKSSIKIFTLLTKSPFSNPAFMNLAPLTRTSNIYSFCKHHKHQEKGPAHEDKSKHAQHNQHGKKHTKQSHGEEKKHQHGPNCNHDHHEPIRPNPKQHHHQHGPNCKHDHGHHREPHKHHEKGQDHDHHAHVKLSKLTFDELIQLKTDEALKYAHQIYEQQNKRLQHLREQKENLMKNLDFYKKLDEQIKEKEKKLADNIKSVQQQTILSKRRAEKQIQQSKSYGVTKIAKELLQVADCVASCRKFAQQSEVKDKYIEEVVRTQDLIREILKKFDIEEFDPTNKEYDPNLQESLVQVPTPPGYKPNHVAMTMRTGYTIKGRLLRSARVGVFS